MYHNKLKVITSVALALSLALGFLALGATSVVYAASQPATSSQQVQINGRAPGFCNYDNDQDEDDWCWSTTSTSSSSTITNTTPMTGSAPAGVVPYGNIIGQMDPYADISGYSNGYGMAGSNLYGDRYGNGRYSLFNFGRMAHEERSPMDRIFDKHGIELQNFQNGQKILLGRGKYCLYADLC